MVLDQFVFWQQLASSACSSSVRKLVGEHRTYQGGHLEDPTRDGQNLKRPPEHQHGQDHPANVWLESRVWRDHLSSRLALCHLLPEANIILCLAQLACARQACLFALIMSAGMYRCEHRSLRIFSIQDCVATQGMSRAV
jgi:hypothetical protein